MNPQCYIWHGSKSHYTSSRWVPPLEHAAMTLQPPSQWVPRSAVDPSCSNNSLFVLAWVLQPQHKHEHLFYVPFSFGAPTLDPPPTDFRKSFAAVASSPVCGVGHHCSGLFTTVLASSLAVSLTPFWCYSDILLPFISQMIQRGSASPTWQLCALDVPGPMSTGLHTSRWTSPTKQIFQTWKSATGIP